MALRGPPRFEACTPAAERRFGYYALPLLWRDRIVGWTNGTVADGVMLPEPRYVSSQTPKDRAFARELDAESERFRSFLAGAER